VDADDQAMGVGDEAPLRLASERVRKDLPQVPADARAARVFQQILQAARTAAGVRETGDGLSTGVAAQRTVEFGPNSQQLEFGVPPRNHRARTDCRTRHHTDECNRHQQEHIGEAMLLDRLAATIPHTSSHPARRRERRCERRTRSL
jgi:hypothetical protein